MATSRLFCRRDETKRNATSLKNFHERRDTLATLRHRYVFLGFRGGLAPSNAYISTVNLPR